MALASTDSSDDSRLLIHITANFTLQPRPTQDSATAEPSASAVASRGAVFSVAVPDAARAGEGFRSFVSSALARIRVLPQRGSAAALDHILESCRVAAAEMALRGSFWRLEIEIDLVVDELPDDESSDEEELPRERFVAASEESIKGLEKRRVEDSEKVCGVCLEDILVGSEATLLPCSHAFDEECIVKWLNTNKYCPLCRFELLNR